MKNIYNKKEVQRMEWIKGDTVVITYSDNTKETMSRTTFNKIIKSQGGRIVNKLFFIVGMIAVCLNVALGSHEQPALAAFGLGLMLVVTINWMYARLGLAV